MEDMDWKKEFEEGKELILSTCSSDNKPNAIVVISLGFLDDKLLIADCKMKNTIENLKQNKRICVIGGYYRINGVAEVFTSGHYFDACKKILSTQDEKLKMKNAVVVSVEDVFDLQKAKKIK